MKNLLCHGILKTMQSLPLSWMHAPEKRFCMCRPIYVTVKSASYNFGFEAFTESECTKMISEEESLQI